MKRLLAVALMFAFLIGGCCKCNPVTYTVTDASGTTYTGMTKIHEGW